MADRRKYLSNSVLVEEVRKGHQKMREIAEEEGIELDDVDNKTFQSIAIRSVTPLLIECMELLVERIATKGQWRGYTYLEDMKSEAKIALMCNGLKFSFEKAGDNPNPFAYFTEIVNKTFKSFILKEKKEHTGRQMLSYEKGLVSNLPYNIQADLDVKRMGLTEPPQMKRKVGRRKRVKKTHFASQQDYKKWLDNEIKKYYEKKGNDDKDS